MKDGPASGGAGAERRAEDPGTYHTCPATRRLFRNLYKYLVPNWCQRARCLSLGEAGILLPYVMLTALQINSMRRGCIFDVLG
jgi:hypothetical protein